MREHEDQSIDVMRMRRERVQLTAAQRSMDYTLWKFGYDIHDIGDGESPLGERVVVVHGLQAAVEQAKMMMRQDPTTQFMKLVPKAPSIFCKSVYVRRRRVAGASRQVLDPGVGSDEFKRE